MKKSTYKFTFLLLFVSAMVNAQIIGIVASNSITPDPVNKITITTSSTLAAWSPTNVINSGNTLRWDVNGANTVNTNDPTFNLSTNPGTVDVNAWSTDNFVGLDTLFIDNLGVTAIDVSKATSLVDFSCKLNSQLQSIDLTSMPLVQRLTIRSNDLQNVNLVNNTALHSLYIYGNVDLAALNIANNPLLHSLNVSGCSLTSDQLDQIVINLNNFGLTGGDLTIAGNAGSLTSASYSAYNSLVAKAWEIDVVAPPAPQGTVDKPFMYDFLVNNTYPNRVYFTASQSVAGLTTAGFKVNLETPLTVVLNPDGLGGYFTLPSNLTYGKIVNIECLNGDGTILDFPKDYVANNIVFTGTEKFVTPTGNGLRNGSNEANAWNLSDLNGQTIAGGTRVNIKVGTYTASSSSGALLIDNGTSANPVIYEGYNIQPGDIVFSPTYAVALNATNMPLFVGNGTSTNNLFAECAGKHDFVFKNIQLKNYYQGFRNFNTTATYNAYFDNVAAEEFGDATYDGGIVFWLQTRSEMSPYNNNIQLKNCYILNASNTNYWIDGNDNFVYNCRSYSNRPTSHLADTDYLFLMYQANNSVFRNLYAEKVGDTGHDGHGLVFKSSEATGVGIPSFGVFNSYMINCTVKNTANPIQFRHSKVANNKAINITIDGSGGNSTGGITFRDGAHDNIADRIYVKNTTGPAIWYGEQGLEDGANQNVYGNIVQNSILVGQNTNGVHAVGFGGNPETGDAMTATGNKIYNNTFYNWDKLYRKYPACADGGGNEFKNNLLHTIDAKYFDANTMAVTEDYNNIYSSYSTSIGNNSTNINPNFVDLIGFVPQANMNVAKLSGINYDYSMTLRKVPTTIGAIEINTADASTGTAVLSNFVINNTNPDRVYFDASTSVAGMTKTGFVISNFTNAQITLTVDPDGLGGYFTVPTAFTYWDNNTIRLGENNNLSDVNPKVHNFTLTLIDNQIPEPDASTIRYAAATTQGAGTGLDAANAWSYAQAFTNATAGMTVWMKAGTSSTQCTIANSGTVGNPIKFIGYKTTPGDITTNYYTPTTTDNWSTTEMPTIDPNNTSSTSIIGLTITDKNYIVIKNLQVTRAGLGIRVWRNTGFLAENVNVKTIGASYNVGIQYYGVWADVNQTYHNMSGAKILNCRVRDITGNGIETTAAGVLVKDCTAYSSTACVGDGTDYLITGAGNNNIYSANLVERQDGVTHGSYYGFKSSDQDLGSYKPGSGVYVCTYNLLEKSTVKRIGRSLKARNSGTNYNVFKDNYVVGITGSAGNGVAIFGAVKYNIWERNYIENQYAFVQYYNNQEDNYDANKVADGNIIRNNIFKNARYWFGIYANDFGGTLQTIAYNNTLVYNNTFYGMETVSNGGAFCNIVYNPSPFTMTGNQFKNNIFYDVNRMDDPSNSAPLYSGWSFLNNDYYAWDVALPTDAGAITANPNFINLTDFVPQNAMYRPALTGVYYDYVKSERATETTVGARKIASEVITTTVTNPILSNFRVENSQPNRVVFDSNGNINGLTKTGFTISGYTNANITLTIDGDGMGGYFTLSTPLTFWDNNTIRLEGGTGAVQDFTMEYIVNNITEPTASTIRYANATTQGTGDGLTEANAWSYATAATNATPGMTVYCKANATAATATMTIANSGTISAPIKFIGYKTTINDITSMYYDYGDGALTNIEMPMIDSNTPGSNKGINLNGKSYVIIKNFQIQDVQDGIHSATAINDIVIENCLLNNIGDGSATYSGFGIGSPYVSTTTNRLRVKNSTLINAKAEAIANYGNFGLIDNCLVYSDDNTQTYSGTDYYIYLEGNNNIVKNSYAKRVGVAHGGHAFGTKAHNPSTYNLWQSNQAHDFKNEMFFVAWAGAQYNVFKNNYAKGTNSADTNGEGCIMIRDGASYNTFENNYLESSSYGVEFAVTGESGTNYGSNNTIRNNIFKGAFRYWLGVLGGATTAVFSNNKIQNNTIYNARQLYRFIGAGTNNEMTGNIFDTASGSTGVSWEQGGSIGMTYSYNNYSNLAYPFPTGTNQTTTNPAFSDLIEFVPTATFTDIDMPKITGINEDYNKNKRASITTIGAVKSDNEIISGLSNSPAKSTITNITGMAIATFVIDLEGGDVETADNALYFKIYGSADAYTTPIKTTGTDLADADVTTSGGIATINNVDVGSETSFKVVSIDANGNHSSKSLIYTVSGSTVEKLIGYPGTYGTTGSITNLRAINVTMPEAGTIQSVWIWSDVDSTSDLIMGLYTDSSTLPNTKVATTAVISGVIKGWNKLNLTNPYSATNGQVLWIAFSSETGITIRYRTATPIGLRASSGTAGYQNPLPDTYPTPSTISADYNLFALYLPTTPASETELFTAASAASPTNEDNSTDEFVNQSYAVVSLETSDLPSGGGSNAVKIATNNGFVWSRAKVNVNVTSGKTYKVTVWAKKSHALPAGFGSDGAGTYGFEGNSYCYITSSTWAEYTLYLKANATQTAELLFWALTDTAGNTGDYILVDRLSIKEIN